MTTAPKQIVLVVRFLIVIVLVGPIIPRTMPSRAQQTKPSLPDVCPVGWNKFTCTGIRLCVNPSLGNVRSYIAGAAPELDNKVGCIDDSFSVPESYTHATQEQLSFYAGYYDVIETPMFMKVYKIDVTEGPGSDAFHEALQKFKAEFNDTKANDVAAYRAGQEARKEVLDAAEADAQIPFPKPEPGPSSAKDVCPSGWERYSCQFARLCIASDYANKHRSGSPEPLENRGQYIFAKCKVDDRTIPDAVTHSTPYEVGFAAGFRLYDTPKYFKVVKIDSSPDDIGTELEKAGLTLLPPSAVQAYAKGWHDGHVEFLHFMEKLRQKEAQSGYT